MSGAAIGERAAPHSIEAEEAVLGSILLDPEVYAECDWLKPDDFFLVRHGWIWEAIQRIAARRDAVDHLTVIADLQQGARLSEVGGAAYVINLLDKTPSALNVESYAHIVERMALRRRLVEAARQIARAAHSDETDIDAVVADSEAALSLALSGRVRRSGILTVGETAGGQFDRMVRAMRGETISPGKITTGLADLDALVGGFRDGDLVYIAARPGMGKSALVQEIAAANAARGVITGIISWEMDKESITTRLLAAEADVPYLAIRDMKLSDAQMEHYAAAYTRLSSCGVPIDDDVLSATPSGLRRSAIHMARDYDIRALFVDYIQLMHADFRMDNRVLEISLISRQLKALARELSIPVVALSQLSRAVEGRIDKRPMLSDLRESGSLEQDADLVGFIYRDAYYDTATPQGNRAQIIIAKHRNGPTGTVDVIWNPARFRFETAARRGIGPGVTFASASSPSEPAQDEPGGDT